MGLTAGVDTIYIPGEFSIITVSLFGMIFMLQCSVAPGFLDMRALSHWK